MKVIDIIFALVCGRMVGFILSDFLHEWGIEVSFLYIFLIWIFLPLLSLFCLWVAFIIGKLFPFIFEGAKFVLVGAFATVFDLKLFEALVWFSGIFFLAHALTLKGISFIVATFLKYWGNKYWSFGKSGRGGYKEIGRFFIITIIGIILDVGAFYYFNKVLGPQFGLSLVLWTKLSVIFAALAAALWNFIGYKHLVFKN